MVQRKNTHSDHPLSPAVFHILLVLVNQERHGYGIMREVAVDTAGVMNLGAGTLYGCLKRMLTSGLIEETARRIDPELDDERRRYYRATVSGLRAAEAEVARLEAAVAAARSKKVFGKRLTGATARR